MKKKRYSYLVIRSEDGNKQDYLFKTLKSAFKFIGTKTRNGNRFLSEGIEIFRVDSKKPYS